MLNFVIAIFLLFIGHIVRMYRTFVIINPYIHRPVKPFWRSLGTGNGRRGNNMQQRATGLNLTQATAARTQPLYMWLLLYQLNNQDAPQMKVIFIKRVLGCGCRAACSCGAETLSCKKSFSACGLDLHITCMPWFSCSQVSRIIKSHKPPVLLSNKVVF